MKKSLEEGQIVLCTVDRIVRTIVFVKIEDYNLEGAITFSEISPGRIRNIREFAFPGKKIVCKVLRIKPEGIDLSLRRVKLKEKNEFNEGYRKEKGFIALIKTVLKEDAEKVIEKIKEETESLQTFIENVKKKSVSLEKYVKKEEAEKIASLLKDKKQKESVLSRKFLLSNKGADGIIIVKEIIKKAIADSGCKGCEISYIAAGKYLVKIKGENLKQADNQLDMLIQNLENAAKKHSCSFSL